MNLIIKYLVPLMVGVTFVSHADNMSNFQPLSSKLWMSQRLERVVESDMVGVILSVNEDFDIEPYRQNGMLVTYQSGNILYATIPADMAKMISNDKNVLSYRRPRQAYPTLDVARQVSGVDELHSGVAINDDIIPYTGRGVVIGIVDGGVNPQHITFNDAQGQSRIKDYVFTQSALETEDYTFVADHFDTSQMLSAPIDYECEGHGTHTASIAAGQCPQNLYYGVAPDADLVLTTMGGKLYDDEIIYGIDAAIDYAEKVKRPLVVSLSLGSVLGPHDGTGEMTDFLAQRLSDNGQIVCFAAGNDGNPSNSFISLTKNFSNDSQPLSTCFARAMYGTPAQSAYMQVWSEDEKMTEICLHVIDLDSREIVYTSEYFNTQTHPQMAETLMLLDTQMLEKSLLPELAHYFDGVVLIAGGISNQNGKHLIELLTEFEGIDEYSQYVLGFSLKSDEGANVLLETNASTCYFRSYGIEGFVNGNPNNSISDYCSSPYVISVGSWNARNSVVDIEGNENFLNEDYFGNHGAVANYSSYGSLIGSDKTLPHVLAPGTNVVAAVASGETIYSDLLINESDGYYWGTKTGTSMACPFAAGVIALWLEAKPDLTRDQIVEIIENSSLVDSAVESAGSKVGAGKIDAYNGLKYIYTRLSDVKKVATQLKPIVRQISNCEIEVVMNVVDSDGIAKLYSIDGIELAKSEFDGNIARVSHNLNVGVYLLTVEAQSKLSTTRILIK